MEWTAYPAETIGLNAQFGGHEGAFTYSPARYGDEIAILRDENRVYQIEYQGRIFTHQNADGANIHGGNQTTSEWFTFGAGQFFLVNEDGSINRDIKLTSKPAFAGANTITVRNPLSAPCFGPYVGVLTEGGVKEVAHLQAGDRVLCMDGVYHRILWTGGREVEVTDKNAPVIWNGETYSPQHRVLIGNAWAKAKHVGDTAAHDATQWYGHILLATHQPITVMGGFAESLLPTERALSGMSAQMRAQIVDALMSEGLTLETYGGLTRPELSKRQLREMEQAERRIAGGMAE